MLCLYRRPPPGPSSFHCSEVEAGAEARESKQPASPANIQYSGNLAQLHTGIATPCHPTIMASLQAGTKPTQQREASSSGNLAGRAGRQADETQTRGTCDRRCRAVSLDTECVVGHTAPDDAAECHEWMAKDLVSESLYCSAALLHDIWQAITNGMNSMPYSIQSDSFCMLFLCRVEVEAQVPERLAS